VLAFAILGDIFFVNDVHPANNKIAINKVTVV